MGKTWLLLDCNYLCHRNFFALGDLSYKELPTAVLYGFFRDIVTLTERFATPHISFAFDCGQGLREQCYPIYKEKRRSRVYTEDEEEKYTTLSQQIWQLRTDFLKYVGYKNVYYQKGYEADDILASMSKSIGLDDQAIIVTADKDLWQCVTERVSCYNPQTKKSVTLQSFYEEWQLQPVQWRDIRCISGCSTDNVPGVEGVAEISAAKYLRGKLGGKKAEAIKKFCNSLLWYRNAQLVFLPYQGCKQFQLEEDRVNTKKWTELMDDLGCKSLRKVYPIPRYTYSKGRGLEKYAKT